MSIANLIRCSGLVTYGNELSRSEGSLQQSLNVNVDEDGVITPRRGFNDYGLPTTGVDASNKDVDQIMEYKSSLIRQFDGSLEYEDSNNVFQSVTGTYTPLRAGYRTKFQEANSNFYFTSDEGIKKISETSRANLNANMISNAGGIKAGYSEGSIVPTVGGFLPPQSKVAYRVLFGTKDNNNNLIYGSPSSRFVVTNFSKDQETYEIQTITFDTGTGGNIVNGDHFIFYSGATKYVVWYSIASGTEPKTSATIGGTYIEVVADGIAGADDSLANFTANEIANNVSNITVDSDGSSIVTITQQGIGNVTDILGGFTSAGASASTKIITAVDTQGETINGLDATVQVKAIVPSDATVDYFYQIYRTSPITVATGLTINDIDPGDEMNLVYEAGLTTTEINNKEFIVTDTTPESFRSSALPLYTNEASGSGILQANDSPPIALDLELFKNHMFYANTKQRHQLEFTIVSVDDFISGSTRIVIGNEDITRFYTFQGTAQVVDVTVDSTPTAGDYINLYSANDSRQYYIYFGASSNNPSISGAIGYRVSLEGSPSTTDLATRIEEALVDNIDFNIPSYSTYDGATIYSVGDLVTFNGFKYTCNTDTTGIDDTSEDPSGTATDNSYWDYVSADNTLAFTYTNNGSTTGIANGIGSSFTVVNVVTGTGEEIGTYEGGKVLRSGLVSVGQAIDQTARSLVKVISSDVNSPVNAYYISTGEELPGNILLEARSLEDKDFYIAIEESSNDAIGDEFTPEIPYSQDITSFEESTDDSALTKISLNAHGYSDGDVVFVGYYKNDSNPSDPDSFSGLFTVQNADTNDFDIAVNNIGLATFDPEFFALYTADVISDNEELSNRVYYSKFKQPEAVPRINFIDIGPQDSQILRILALRDELYVLKEDGVYVISGSSAPDPQTGTGGWSTRLIDSAQILAPDSAVVLNNQIYCLSDQGVIRISGSSAAVISRGTENRINTIVDSDYDYTANTFGVAYENDRAYILFTPQQSSDTSSTQAYRYNIFEKTWSRWEYDAHCGLVMKRDNKMYLGNSTRNYVSQERKNNNRTDYADRNFSASISTNGVSQKTITLSTLTNVKVNDVILQDQSVSIYYINWKLLKKMDFFDTGITAPSGFDTMFEAFEVEAGDNLATAMQNINDHLRTLDATNITSKTFTTSNLLTNTELLVTELNTTATITSIKTYKSPQAVTYEAYITEVDTLRNQVTIHTERPFVEDSVEIYKGYTCTVEWNPLHFGNPSAVKQISHMSILFDQNNFNGAVAKFYSDSSQGKVEVPFASKGLGYWGDMTWGENTAYWGGEGNDMPFRTIVPRNKQKCRYISPIFEHKIARESFRLIGISGTVREISSKTNRQLK